MSDSLSQEIAGGDGLALSQIPALLPPRATGEPITTNCVWRWITSGLLVGGNRVRLEGRRVGGRWLTSRPALERFLSACALQGGSAPAASQRQPNTGAEGCSHG